MIHVICCGGGGLAGIRQVAYLDTMLARANAAAVTPDGWVGVSTGAITSAMMAAAGEDAALQAQCDRMRQFYFNLRRREDLTSVKFPGGLMGQLRGLLDRRQAALGDPGMFRAMLARYLPHEHKRPCVIGRTSLTSGRYSELLAEPGNMAQVVMHSSSVPVVWPASNDPWMWVDGGVAEITPIAGAIRLAKDLAIAKALGDSLVLGRHRTWAQAPTESLRITVLMCSPLDLDSWHPPQPPTGIEVARRAFAILMHEHYRDDLRRVLDHNQDSSRWLVDLKVWAPDAINEDEHIADALDVNPEAIANMYTYARRRTGPFTDGELAHLLED